MYEELKEIVEQFPLDPGVYIMKNTQGEIIYVGKAKNLYKRVNSYITGSSDVKTRVLVNNINTIEHIVTRNEYEALLLENNLIKKWQPRYNISLKDGKTYPVIRITNEEFPRIFRTRKIVQDGSLYFGPFTSTGMLDTYLDFINKMIHVRKCRGRLKKRYSPCMYYHIGRCFAPCCGKISKERYMEYVDKVKQLLSGNTKELTMDIKEKMNRAVKALEFEEAAKYRDAIESINIINREQKVVDFNPEKRDYIAYSIKENLCTFVTLQMRSGKLVGQQIYRTRVYTLEDEACLGFLFQYYRDSKEIPEKIYLPVSLDTVLITEFFKKEKGKKVEIIFSQKGKHASILRFAKANAYQDIEKRKKAIENIPALKELAKVLSLGKIPRRIEGFDIAHLQGEYTVSSLVSFYDGKPDKKNYRHFHIKTLSGAVDDYKAIREAVARRYTRVFNEGLERPDLILVDGGKGQVSSAKSVLSAIGLDDIPVAGLAKKNEELYQPGKEPLKLPETSQALKILQAVRDESHRFATTFNRQLRKKNLFFPLLEKIPGIGPVRSSKLLKAYGSLENILKADIDDISDKGGIPLYAAEEVKKYLGKEKFDIIKKIY